MDKRLAPSERAKAGREHSPGSGREALVRYLAKWAAERDHAVSRTKARDPDRQSGGKSDSPKGEGP